MLIGFIGVVCFTQIAAPLVSAENIFIQVSGNATAGDNTTVFSPQRVVAQSGDIVFFNCASHDLPLIRKRVLNIYHNAACSHCWQPLCDPVYLRRSMHSRTRHEHHHQWL